jgi:hypothetical protein
MELELMAENIFAVRSTWKIANCRVAADQQAKPPRHITRKCDRQYANRGYDWLRCPLENQRLISINMSATRIRDGVAAPG